MKVQGEYRKYDSGVTIEVNNLSNKALPDLKFLYSNSTEVGTVKSLEPGGTAKITGNSKEIKGSDISLYLNYYIENGGKKRG